VQRRGNAGDFRRFERLAKCASCFIEPAFFEIHVANIRQRARSAPRIMRGAESGESPLITSTALDPVSGSTLHIAQLIHRPGGATLVFQPIKYFRSLAERPDSSTVVTSDL
jgi:hypothetical protein